MSKRSALILAVVLISFGLLGLYLCDESVFTPNQTSASLLYKFAQEQRGQAAPANAGEADKKYLMISDVYIKARSYAWLNKVFFGLSVLLALAVLLWPSLSVIFKESLSTREWMRSPTVQTTVTGLAALMFAFYAQYKDKQTNAETLMRHVTYSKAPVAELSVKVSAELARIDRGFSFDSILDEKGASNGNGKGE